MLLLHSLYCYQESSHTADTLLLSRVHHVGSIADCARKPGARSSVYYRALPRTVDGGSPGARGHTCKYIYIYIYIHIYIYIYIRHPRSHTARLLASLRSAMTICILFESFHLTSTSSYVSQSWLKLLQSKALLNQLQLHHHI